MFFRNYLKFTLIFSITIEAPFSFYKSIVWLIYTFVINCMFSTILLLKLNNIIVNVPLNFKLANFVNTLSFYIIFIQFKTFKSHITLILTLKPIACPSLIQVALEILYRNNVFDLIPNFIYFF